MGRYAMFTLADGHFSFLGMAAAQDLSSKLDLLQMITTFPFNVIVGMAMVLAVGTVLAFTRKPAGNTTGKNDSTRTMEKVDGDVPQRVMADPVNQPVEEFVEEMPRRFQDYRDGVVKLYNWFFRFSQSRFGEIADSMTPREFKRAVLRRLPSKMDSTLEYLVTSFEISNYGDSKLTKEVLDRSLRAVELLKGVIERGSSGDDPQHPLNDESTTMLMNIDENSALRQRSITNTQS